MASGDRLAYWEAPDGNPPAANFATNDLRNNQSIFDFDPTTNETRYFSFLMPDWYAGTTGITAHHIIAMSSAVADTIDCDGQFKRKLIGTFDMDTVVFAAVQSNDNTTVPGSSGVQIDIVITFTDGAQIDNIVAGDPFIYAFIRDAVNDDAAGDMELVSVELKET